MGAYSNVAHARTRRINSSGNRNVASHSALRNCLFADRPHRNNPSRPNLADPTHHESKTHTPYPTQPSFLRSHSCCWPPIHFLPPLTLLCSRCASHRRAARRRYQAPPPAVRSGRTWPLNAAADDDHGEEQDPDLARRGQGGSQAAAASRACACRRWRSSSTAPASASPAAHQVSHYSAAPCPGVRVCKNLPGQGLIL
jgi:hypothetical protein